MRGTKTQSGFTLIEVVIAITLTSGVVLMLFVGLRISINALRSGNAHLDQEGKSTAEFDAMERQISAAVPMRISGIEDGRTLNTMCFKASDRQVQFLTAASWSGDRATDFWLASYWIVARSDGQQLLIGETPVPDTEHIWQALLISDFATMHSEAIGAPANRIELLYWQSASQGSTAGWASAWQATGKQELPPALQIRWLRGQDEQVATFLVPVTEEVK